MNKEEKGDRIKRAKEFIKETFLYEPDENDRNYDASFENPEKPYYAIAWWDSGYNGNFEDMEGLEELFGEKLHANYDEGFEIALYDVDNDKELCEYTDYEVKSKVQIYLK